MGDASLDEDWKGGGGEGGRESERQKPIRSIHLDVLTHESSR